MYRFLNSLRFCYVIRSAIIKKKSMHLSGTILVSSSLGHFPTQLSRWQWDWDARLGWKSHQTACLIQTDVSLVFNVQLNKEWSEQPAVPFRVYNTTKFSIPLPCPFSHYGIFEGRGWSRRRCIMLQTWLPALRTFDISHWPDECVSREK